MMLGQEPPAVQGAKKLGFWYGENDWFYGDVD
jgi:hypothetical protein